jgi:hypothetical protein
VHLHRRDATRHHEHDRGEGRAESGSHGSLHRYAAVANGAHPPRQ